MATQARGFRLQLSVLRALMVREALMRHGHENIGFFWVILEPLLFASGVAFIWWLSGRVEGHNVNVIAFALTGYISITMWRHINGTVLHLLRRNLGLRYHAVVRPLDIYLGRVLLEVLGCLAAFYVAYVPLAVLGVIDPMRDPLLAMGGFWLLAWFCVAFGLVLAALSELSEVLERVLPAVMYITLPLTGIFTMQAWLPEKARYFLSWSPMVNAVEMLRNGMFSEDVTAYWDAWYLVWCSFGLTVVGLVLFDYVRRRVDMT